MTDINRQIRIRFAEGKALRLGFTAEDWSRWLHAHNRRLKCPPIDLLEDAHGLGRVVTALEKDRPLPGRPFRCAD